MDFQREVKRKSENLRGFLSGEQLAAGTSVQRDKKVLY